MNDIKNNLLIKKAFELAHNNKTKELEKLLIKKKVDVNCTDEFRNPEDCNTLVYFASYFNLLDVLKVLVKYNVDLNKENKYGNTPIFAVCDQKKGLNTLKFLVNNGADVNHLNKENVPAIKIAKDSYQDEIYDYLYKITDKKILNELEKEYAF